MGRQEGSQEGRERALRDRMEAGRARREREGRWKEGRRQRVEGEQQAGKY